MVRRAVSRHRDDGVGAEARVGAEDRLGKMRREHLGLYCWLEKLRCETGRMKGSSLVWKDEGNIMKT